MTLPPGQRAIDGLPRFGTHLHRPAPDVPIDPIITISGAASGPLVVPVAGLANLSRQQQNSDLHCVAGWSATGLHWEGVPFQTFFTEIIEPLIEPGSTITHLVFGGLDGHRAAVSVQDAIEDDVLIAESLDGQPLSADQGAPLRLVSPKQYAFISVKHLSRIEVHTTEPPSVNSTPAMRVLAPHSRARVWKEERHQYLPGWSLRYPYGLLSWPIGRLSAMGQQLRLPRRDTDMEI